MNQSHVRQDERLTMSKARKKGLNTHMWQTHQHVTRMLSYRLSLVVPQTHAYKISHLTKPSLRGVIYSRSCHKSKKKIQQKRKRPLWRIFLSIENSCPWVRCQRLRYKRKVWVTWWQRAKHIQKLIIPSRNGNFYVTHLTIYLRWG